MQPDFSLAVIIPCYQVKNFIFDVLAAIGPEVSAIYVVDDACPQHTGQSVQTGTTGPRVTVLYHT